MSRPYFDKIFDFGKGRRGIKLHNSSYLEELTGLLVSVASKIRKKTNYFFEDAFFVTDPRVPNCSYNEFKNEFKNTFLYGSGDNINIIRGYSGIGKTTFFEKGIKKLISNEAKYKGKYIKLNIDFGHIDQKEKINFYENWIYERLNKKAIAAIKMLGIDDIYPEFHKKYYEFCKCIPEIEDDYIFPVMYFCQKIYSSYERPCVIIFDNIDLSCVETQMNVFSATAKICRNLSDFMNAQGCSDYYRIFFAMRPETFYRSGDINTGSFINFPLPNILKITLESIKKILLDTANEFDKKRNLICSINFHNIVKDESMKAESFLDVANYFNQILEHYLLKLWQGGVVERLGKNEEFHCDIVNYNIRKFLIFFADTLSNGGFRPLTKEFNEKPSNYTIFDYIEMIIRGRWIVHPGNTFIDGEGGNGTPIIFNLFDTSLWDNTQENKIKHFMLNIRILQYFGFRCNKDEKIIYHELKNCLSKFYDPEHIKMAMKRLVYVGIIYSFFQGDNAASKRSSNEVIIEDDTELCLREVGEFYIGKLIYEFEYMYQMALSSLMPNEDVKYLSESKRYQFEKERAVLCFLKGIFEILKINVEEYNESGNLTSFKKIFCQDSSICKPYRKMLESFITVMKNKIHKATEKRTNKLSKLKEVLCEAQKLELEANKILAQL